MQPREAYEHLVERFDRIRRVEEASQILGWDRAAMMPPEGIEMRSGQMAALDRHARELLRAPEVETWLSEAARGVDEWTPFERANLREMRRQWKIRTAPPSDLASAWVESGVRCRSVWREARPEDDFERLVPHLKEVVDLTSRLADALGDAFDLAPYDALLERHSPGLRTREVDALFADVEAFLPPILERTLERQRRNPNPVRPDASIAPERQESAARTLMEAIGFDFDWGRLDTSPHGFCAGSRHDVRITVDWKPEEFRAGIYTVLHETGHAMYNRQLPADWHRQPVGAPRGTTIHESQSLLVERYASRTPEFCRFAGPIFRESFGHPEVFEPENLHRAVTRVRPGLIRVAADEVTYPLHVLIRYDLERRLLSGTLRVEDLPEAWNTAMREKLDLEPPNDRDGCMQDMHWMDGTFGYFPTYLLGAMAAAQLFETAHDEIPGLRDGLAEGNFAPLMNWLGDTIHRKGSLLETDELLEAATGTNLGSDALRRHLEARYT